jgi:hypothetical protein
MKFALLYYYNPAQAGPTEEEFADWMSLDTAVKEAGAHVYEAGFYGAEQAQTISVRGGQMTTEEGSVMAEANVMAGFWVIEVPDESAAVEWAQRLPTAQYGKVEIRTVVEFEA